ncbi:MAG: glycosyltransferase 87 family protein, partial [Acidimicrobiales bacterium]
MTVVGGRRVRAQGSWATRLSRRAGAVVRTWEPEEGDAILYGLSALFAVATIAVSGRVLYRQWAILAVGPYGFAGLASLGVAVHRRRTRRRATADRPVRSGRHWSTPRIVLFLVALFGATLIPLSLEVAWRSEGNGAAHVQPEVSVVEQAAKRAVHGLDPYHATVKNGKPVSLVKGEPDYESFYPYLPLMTVFGLPSSTHAPIRLTDARIMFSGVTLLVVVGALMVLRVPSERKVRTLQVLTVLPTAALLLATGGDDMPIVAFLLLAMALAQRRRPGWSGIVLGVVSAMKFTAWPLAVLALVAARDATGKRAAGKMALGFLVVAGPVVLPFLILNPHVF